MAADATLRGEESTVCPPLSSIVSAPLTTIAFYFFHYTPFQRSAMKHITLGLLPKPKMTLTSTPGALVSIPLRGPISGQLLEDWALCMGL